MKSLPKGSQPVKLNWQTRIKPIPWYKRRPAESDSAFIKELVAAFYGYKGFYFWIKLNDFFALNFDIWNPGCIMIKEKAFYMSFEIDYRTIRKILIFLMEKHKVFCYLEVTRDLFLYYPEFEEMTRTYRKKLLKDDEGRGIKEPENVGKMSTFCKTFATAFIENKRLMPDFVITPFSSSLREVNNKKESIKDDRGKLEELD